MNTSSALQDWLTLAQIPHFGSGRLQKLLAHFGSISEICRASAHTLSHHRLQPHEIALIKNPHQKTIDETLSWAAQKNCAVISSQDALYPALLSEISSQPLLLFAQGDLSCLSQPQIAMVGSRHPSRSGAEIAENFAAQLAQAGLVVTSGLAAGIDTACHIGALSTGKTIAVLGSGLCHIYPKQNAKLAERIADKGCLISEWSPHTPPQRTHFPRRNRIISGLSLGVLVVEAAKKSGSLITADFALQQNREVFAIPGAIHNPLSQGTLSLIQQGAKCVTSVADILEEWPITPHLTSQVGVTGPLDAEAAQVLACIENEPTAIDQICIRSKLSPHLVSAALVTLELDGRIHQTQGAYTRV